MRKELIRSRSYPKEELLEKMCTTTQQKLTQDITCYNVC